LLFGLAEGAFKRDPRIKRHKLAEKEAKKRAKQEKIDAVKRVREEQERKEAEEREAKEREAKSKAEEVPPAPSRQLHHFFSFSFSSFLR
jgi:septal ring factor EnvC (AmiA/AmiB activator)